MKLLLLLLTLPLLGYNQTTVIAKKTKKAIYVGADSKVNIYKTAPFTHEMIKVADTMCKIWHKGKVGFAVLGLEIFKAKEMAIDVCGKYHSMPEIIEKYIDTFGSHLSGLMNRIENADPRYYNQIMTEYSPYMSQIFFFGIDSDTLLLYVVRFGPAKNEFGHQQLAVYTGSVGMVAGGKIDEISDKVNDSSTWKREKNIPKNIKSMIIVEATAQPDWVGEPIDLIKFTKKKVKWIYKQKACKN